MSAVFNFSITAKTLLPTLIHQKCSVFAFSVDCNKINQANVVLKSIENLL